MEEFNILLCSRGQDHCLCGTGDANPSVGQEAEGSGTRGEPGPWTLLGFPWERQGQGRVNSLDLANLNSFGEL